jgi:RuvA, C-terminal domain
MLGMQQIGVERTESKWRTAHEALSRLAQQRAAVDEEEGRWLLAAERAAVHAHLGFGSFFEYVERLFGYKPRSIHEKLRVAEALENLPALASALRDGRINWSAVRELTRVAVAETESSWLELAAGKTLRQLEELVAGKRAGDLPSAAPDPSALRHVLRFEVTGETFALVREALAELRRRSDTALNDDTALLEMARHVLVGPRDEGRSSYQIAIQRCPECSSARQAANGQLVPLAADILEMAECDGQSLPPLERDPARPPTAHVGTRAAQSIPPALRRALLHRDQHRCRVPGCRNAIFLDVHHVQLRSAGGPNTAENLLTVCGVRHRALHRGQLRVDGPADALRFSHADGRAYGHALPPRPLEVQANVHAGLRGLGFREGEVQTALAELRQREELREASAEQWLRQALLRLRRPSAHLRH